MAWLIGIPLRAKARAEGRGESKWVLKVLLGGRWRGEGSFYSLGLKGSVNRLNTSETGGNRTVHIWIPKYE